MRINNCFVEIIEECDEIGEASYNIRLNICQKKIEWIIFIEYDEVISKMSFVDIIPVLSSFLPLGYDPYRALTKILSVTPQDNGKYDINQLVAILIEDLLASQAIRLNRLENNRFMVTLEMLSTLENVVILQYDDDQTKILIELPLLDKKRLYLSSLDYLVDVTELDPIYLSIIMTLNNDNFTTETSIRFPSNMPCSKHIEVPKWNSDSILFDFLHECEARLSSGWVSRKSFVEELQRISVCVVEIRLTSTFPASCPLLSLFDFQTTLSTTIDSSLLKFNSQWTPQRIARELFIISYELIRDQAFGETVTAS